MVVTMPAVAAHANGDHYDKGQSSNSCVSDQRDKYLNHEDQGVSHSKDYRTSKESRNHRDSKKCDKPVTPEDPIIPEEPVTPVEPAIPEDPIIPEEPVTPVEPAPPEDPITPEDPVTPVEPATPELTTVNPHEGNTWWVGADGQRIALINSNQAKDPTYAQLVSFIQKDTTDQKRYTQTYACGDFAETVHNNAENAGIKAGWVSLNGINHACNAFQTSDKGLVFIDCTGTPEGGECYDTTVSVSAGKQYIRVPLFCSNTYFDSMGTVKDYKIYW